MSLDGNNKDIFREGVIKQTFHFTTMTFQISHLIAFLNIWYKGQILYLTINKAETHAATFLLVSIFSFLAAWHTRPADYICKMAKFFSRLGITCLAGGARLLDQGGGHKKLLHSLSPGWPPYSAGVHVSCTVYSVQCTVHTTFPPPGSWLAVLCRASPCNQGQTHPGRSSTATLGTEGIGSS